MFYRAFKLYQSENGSDVESSVSKLSLLNSTQGSALEFNQKGVSKYKIRA